MLKYSKKVHQRTLWCATIRCWCDGTHWTCEYVSEWGYESVQMHFKCDGGGTKYIWVGFEYLSAWCLSGREGKVGYRETLPRLNVYILKELEINQVLGSWIRRKSWPWFFLRALLCPADVDDGDLIELMGPGLGSSPLCAHCLHDAWISPHHHSQGWCKKRERLRGWL